MPKTLQARKISRSRKILWTALCVMPLGAFASAPYTYVQTTADVQTSAVSRYVTLTVHLRNIGGIATACVVKASGQKRVTGLSANGDAEVTFGSLRNYHGYTVTCEVN